MKVTLLIFVLAASVFASEQTNAIHVWTLKSGDHFTGDYFTSGAQMVVIKNHGTNCLLKIVDLTTNDWLYFQDCKTAALQRQLDAEAAQLKAAGKIELDATLMEHFPEKVVNRQCWIDGEFNELNDLFVYGKDKDYLLGFFIKDRDGKNCISGVFKKNPHDDQPAPELAEVMKLKHGDRVRLLGCPLESEDGNRQLRFYVNHVEVIQTKAEVDVIEAMKPDEGLKFPER
jgi:hypothetical protein